MKIMSVDDEANLRMATEYIASQKMEAIRMALGFASVVGGLQGHQIEAGAQYLERELTASLNSIMMLTRGISAESLLDALRERQPILVPKALIPPGDIIWDDAPVTRRGRLSAPHVTIAVRRDRAAKFELFPRHIQLLASVLAGDEENGVIANGFHIGLPTVKTYFEQIYSRLQVTGKTSAAVKSVRERILYWGI